ncbi:MAG: DUF418 domain-containing protein [Propioniciclava sp.]
MPSPTPSPPRTATRSLAPDLARGFMLLLIACANSTWYLWGHPRLMFGIHPTDGSQVDQILRAVMAIAVDGRVYPMFAFLFGYGMVQFARARTVRGMPELEMRRQLRRRHLWLLLFGFIHAALLFAGDILSAYGLTGLILVALGFRARDTTLAIWSLVLIGLSWMGAVLSLISGWALLNADIDVPAEIWGMSFSSVDLMTGVSGYGTSVLLRLLVWAFTGPSMVLAGIIPTAVLIGWIAARRRVLEEPGRHRRLLTRVAAGGITLGWLGGVPLALERLGRPLFPEILSWAPLLLDYTLGLAGGLGYVALFGLISARVTRPRGPWRAVAALGERSLSGYLWQSIVMAPLLAAWGLALGAQLNTTGILGVAALTWLLSVPLAWWLSTRGRRGPFEAWLRRLTQAGRPHSTPAPATPVAPVSE